MLDPNRRSLYTALLTPPPGCVLEEALGTTFTMELTALLTVPVHLSLLGDERKEDGIAIYEALRRVMKKLTLYLERGRALAPRWGNPLFGLLAPCIVEVNPPSHGIFHPKVWVLRFRSLDAGAAGRMRLVVLSRNLTFDRSWDLSLQLEGEIGNIPVPENEPIAKLVRRLPQMAAVSPDAKRVQQAGDLAAALERCRFDLPDGVESLRFAIPGLEGTNWTPGRCDRFAVISPFCTDHALTGLTQHCKTPAALISRPETLDELKAGTRALFSSCYVLHEYAEKEDTDETADDDEGSPAPQDRFGLHAKAYIAEHGARTRLTIGSANATGGGLHGTNIELLVTLEGRKSRLGNIDGLLDANGLGEVLVEHRPLETPPEKDPDAEAAEQRLEKARKAIVEADLKVMCEPPQDDERWRLLLVGNIAVPESVTAKVWPVSCDAKNAADLAGYRGKVAVALVGPAHLTGVLGFELRDPDAPTPVRFALNLPVEGLPEDLREAAILHSVISNSEGFLRYLLMLLAGGDEGVEGGITSPGSGGFGSWNGDFGEDLPLLEELTRAYSRNPQRLHEIARIVRKLRSRQEAADLIPDEFEEIWEVYEKALNQSDD